MGSNTNNSGEKERSMFYDTKVQTLVENETTHIIQMQNDDGDGLMSFYTVFPGISLLFSDFHMEQ